MQLKTVLAALIAVQFALPVFSSEQEFIPVSKFNPSRYLGEWYEIARMPHSFERGLIRVTAGYSLDGKGGIAVTNKGIKKSSGKPSLANGKAKFAADTATGHLKVAFFGPFYSDYIIVELDTAGYSYALVTGSSTDYLWILSRTPSLDSAVLKKLMEKARILGFDLSRLYMVPQE